MSTVSAKTRAFHSFCWADLACNDHGACKTFYKALFGWSAEDAPGKDGAPYTMLKSGDNEVGGMYQKDAELLAHGGPSYWTSYVLVEDCDQMAKNIESLGGKLCMPPFDVGGNGRMAIAFDPTGACFALWQNSEKRDTPELTGHGTFCWNELLSKDPKTSIQFFQDLFGWSSKPFSDSSDDYTLFMQDGKEVGGVMALPEEAQKNGAPSYWLLYTAVDDCDKIVAKTKELGGSVHLPAKEFEGVGRGSVLADPNGGTFGVICLHHC